MKRNTLFLLAVLSSALPACGSKDALENALSQLPPPAKNPDLQTPARAQGKLSGKAFEALSAGITRDPYIPGLYQITVYSEDHGSACYGIGNTYVKIPVSQTGTVGRHELRTGDRTAMAVFTDGIREMREGKGYIEILELTSQSGRAKLSIGQAEQDNFLEGELTFENCLK